MMFPRYEPQKSVKGTVNDVYVAVHRHTQRKFCATFVQTECYKYMLISIPFPDQKAERPFFNRLIDERAYEFRHHVPTGTSFGDYDLLYYSSIEEYIQERGSRSITG